MSDERLIKTEPILPLIDRRIMKAALHHFCAGTPDVLALLLDDGSIVTVSTDGDDPGREWITVEIDHV